jgi:tape measure domain-containing protein
VASNIVEIIYALIDKVSPKAKQVSTALAVIDEKAAKAGGSVDSLEKKQSKLSASMVEFVAVSAGIVYGLKKIGESVIGAAIKYEQQEMAFTSMLGSSLRAQELISEIQQTAASTPFEQTDLIDYAKKLIAVGVASDEVIPAMRMLGDVASALGTEKLPQIVRGYSDIQAAGRAMGGDLKQLRDAAVPIERYLSQVLGVTQSQVRKLGEESKISAEDVKKAFQLMTSEGEKFHGMMAAQSKTTGGALSNLRDQLGILAISFGAPLLAPLNFLIGALNSFLGLIRKLSPETKTFISVSVAVAAGVMGLVTAFGLLAIAIGGAKLALIALASSTGIGLVVAAVGLLGVAVYKDMPAIQLAFYETSISIGQNILSIINYINSLLDVLNKIPGTLKLSIGTTGLEGFIADAKKSAAEIKAQMVKAEKERKAAAEKEKADAAASRAKELADKKMAEENAKNDKLRIEKEASDQALESAQEEARKAKEILLQQKDDELEIRRKAIAAQLLMQHVVGEQETAFAQSQADKHREINARLAADTIALAQADFARQNELDNLSIEDKILRAEEELSRENLSSESKNAISQKLYDLELERMAALDAKKKLQNSMFLESFAKFGEGQLSLQEAINGGMLDFFKQIAYAKLDIEAANLFQTGMGLLTASMFTNPMGYAHLAGAALISAGSRAAIGSIKLAEGGIVMPQSGGVQATIGEGGRAEAVIPLDDPRSQEVLGGGGNSSRVIILDADGMTTLAKGVYKKQTEMLRTGELTPRK